MKSDNVVAMFNRIAFRYDTLNKLLSFNVDVYWRKKVARCLPRKNGLEVLDLATGTGELALTMCKENSNITKVYGVDIASNMIALGKKKVISQCLEKRVFLEVGDAARLDCDDESFDVVTTAFGIRNMQSKSQVFQEVKRVLRNNGQLLVLEFSMPTSYFVRQAYLLYFRYLLPFIGGVISGDRKAYQYLNQSAEKFPSGVAFKECLLDAGFSKVEIRPMTFGIVTLYICSKEKL